MKTILVDALGTFVIQGTGIVPELYELLESFPNRKIILTNANAEERAAFLPDMPYEVFSLDHNPEKTDPSYYRHMLAHFGLAPDQVVYFEHNPDAVLSARSIGIDTYLYEETTDKLALLTAFLRTRTEVKI